jgi:predicted O-methyltransferase YrrM
MTSMTPPAPGIATAPKGDSGLSPALEKNQILADIYRTRTVRLPSGESRCADENGMPQAEGADLYQLILRERPETTLEVGLAFGLSALFICQALAEGRGRRHIVMDPNQTTDYHGAGLHHLRQAGLSHLVEFHEESSHRVLPRLEAAATRLDFAFIDGVHLFDYTLVEFFFIDKMLRPGGLVVFDDLQLPAVRKVVRFAVSNRGYRDESLSPDTGRVRRAGRRVKRLLRRLRVFPKSLAFALAGERRELLCQEIGWPRRNGLAVLRKTTEDNRFWQHHVDF